MNYKYNHQKGKALRKQKLPLWKAALPLLALLQGQALATPGQDLQQALVKDAKQRLATYARQLDWPQYQAKASAWVPDSADHLPPCNQPLRLAPSRLGAEPWGRIPYDVSCSAPAWQLRARVEVKVSLPVWTARQGIRRGQLIEAADLLRRTLPLEGIYGGFVTDQRQLIGQQAKRNLRRGQVLGPGTVAAPLLVQKGENVVIRVDQQGVRASMKGVALSGGARGESVQVRNLSSGKEITAWVVDKGIVETRF
ncbi:lateral flagellar basal body P-ring biosynthesis protein, LfgA [Gallaecimonas xiamenensis 3-C-1]|uniref:Flagella basal body P-ring formation protein FlgA n=1 Tax=Gallaecimonas xiamenensis 3-C-1 TaxID=745411 RepID=K2JHC1_9GAMM|nr:lateral flagellar basal body P-ring biosynthesis protein, LfgA [Gallaecimonas xiamenensis 3-C-1]